MAIVKAIKYKVGGNATPSALKAVITYCLQPYKTEISEKVYCTSGVNCNPQFAYQEFMATKLAFGKAEGVFFYHYVQSFSVNEEITPQGANAIGLEFAKEAWPGHEVLIGTHRDVAHLHNHFIINSVNYENGLKLRQNPNTLIELRKISDRICENHGLTVLTPYTKSKVQSLSNGEYRKAAKGNSWKFRLMSAINKAMNISGTKAEFIQNMKQQGYDVLWTDNRKYITYTCLREEKFKDGSYKKCRDNKLHDLKYLKENMEGEFYEREQLFEKAYTRGTDEAQWGSDTRKRNDCEQTPTIGFGPGAGTGKSDIRNSRVEKAERKSYCDDGEFYADIQQSYTIDNRSRDAKSTCKSEETDRTNDLGCQRECERTGWEGSRKSYQVYKQAENSRQLPLGTVSRRHSNSDNLCTGIGYLHGLASSFQLIDENEETEEEKREREARNTSAAIGVSVGLAIGAVKAINAYRGDQSSMDEQTDEEIEEELTDENDSYFTLTM